MQYLVVGLFVSITACTFDSSAVGIGRDGATSIDARMDDASVIDGSIVGGADATIWDARPVMQLVGTAITRHYIDEKASGQATATLDDSVVPADDLVVTVDDRDATNPSYFELGPGMRGLVFDSMLNPDVQDDPISSFARASVATSTKIRNAFHNKKLGTIELVIDVDAFGWMGRLLFLGHGIESDFALHASPGNVAALTFTMAHSKTMSWDIDLADQAQGRLVLHVVVDTDQDTDADRVKLYLDSVLQIAIPGSGGEMIGKNEAIVFHGPPMDHFYVLGNREIGGRPVKGTFYYAALYGSALTLAEIQNNTEVLTLNDDTP